MNNTRRLTIALSSFAMLLAGCAADVACPACETTTTNPLAKEQSCTGGLCVAAEAQHSMAIVKSELAACVPVDGDKSDATGLRISAIRVTSVDGDDLRLEVTMANVSPHGMFSYPGIRLVAETYGAQVAKPGDWMLYGIIGCSESVGSFGVKLGANSASLTAGVFQLGEENATSDRVTFSLQR